MSLFHRMDFVDRGVLLWTVLLEYLIVVRNTLINEYVLP